MMSNCRRRFIVPVLVLLVGVGWLLNQAEIVRGVDWLWTGFLGLSGLAILTLSRWTRSSVVAGVVLLLAAVASVLRQTGRLAVEWEIPMLVVTLGILMILGQLLPLPSGGAPPEDKNK